MLSESECKNSGGWFKDPFTGEDIGPDYPRVLTCKPGEKWQQPAVCFQDGNIAKISGRCWNDDERACYREYRGLPSKSNTHAVQRKPRVSVANHDTNPDTVSNQIKNTETFDTVLYDEESTSTPMTLAILANCDKIYGCNLISGIMYSLCHETGSNRVHYIPRRLIPDDEFSRLCLGESY